MEWPKAGQLVLPDSISTITPWSDCSLGGIWGGMGYPSSGLWVAANRAQYVPFRLATPFLIRQMFVANGTTVAGTNSCDIGVYDHVFTKLVSTGSQLTTGTSVDQLFDITDYQLGPGLFYLALVLNSTEHTLRNSGIAAFATQAVGMAQQATAFPLPAIATPASHAGLFLPLFGLVGRAFL